MIEDLEVRVGHKVLVETRADRGHPSVGIEPVRVMIETIAVNHRRIGAVDVVTVLPMAEVPTRATADAIHDQTETDGQAVPGVVMILVVAITDETGPQAQIATHVLDETISADRVKAEITVPVVMMLGVHVQQNGTIDALGHHSQIPVLMTAARQVNAQAVVTAEPQVVAMTVVIAQVPTVDNDLNEELVEVPAGHGPQTPATGINRIPDAHLITGTRVTRIEPRARTQSLKKYSTSTSRYCRRKFDANSRHLPPMCKSERKNCWQQHAS